MIGKKKSGSKLARVKQDRMKKVDKRWFKEINVFELEGELRVPAINIAGYATLFLRGRYGKLTAEQKGYMSDINVEAERIIRVAQYLVTGDMKDITEERVLRTLRTHKATPINAKDLAKELGVYDSWNTIEMHLCHLVEEKKAVEIEDSLFLARG
ncbi:MAG TPA: hypothetical protein VNF06_03130 [Candidatus Aquilonibacter sp.]|nr:hypothetical protein [Candidatus Aquilonibacter sp.]